MLDSENSTFELQMNFSSSKKKKTLLNVHNNTEGLPNEEITKDNVYEYGVSLTTKSGLLIVH